MGVPFVGVGVSPPPRHSLAASHSIASNSVAASCTSLSESRRALTRGRSFEANPLSGAFPAFPSVPAGGEKRKGMTKGLLSYFVKRGPVRSSTRVTLPRDSLQPRPKQFEGRKNEDILIFFSPFFVFLWAWTGLVRGYG